MVLKRIDTWLRKWSAKAIKKRSLKGSASFTRVSRKVSQRRLLPCHGRHERIIILSRQTSELVYGSEKRSGMVADDA